MSSETGCFLRVSETVCVLRVSETVCVLRDSMCPQRQCVSPVRQYVSSETVCVLTVCVPRDSETVCVLRDSMCPQRQCVSPETVCVPRDSETVCVKLKLIIKVTSWDSNVSHEESSSLPLVLLVNNRFRSRGLELFISFTRNVFSKCHRRGRCNLHIDTIPDVLPAVLPAFSSCN